MPTCKQICNGEGGCILDVLLFIPVMIYNAFDIYIFACWKIVCSRSYRLWCGSCIKCCGTWEYTDTSFEGAKAIGKEGGANLDWVRAADLVSDGGKGGKPFLFEAGIDPADLCQGAVGDCWLVAALASAAEHDASIRNCFITPEYNPRGEYKVRGRRRSRNFFAAELIVSALACLQIRLWDPTAKAWEIVTIDDRIPCKKGTKVLLIRGKPARHPCPLVARLPPRLAPLLICRALTEDVARGGD